MLTVDICNPVAGQVLDKFALEQNQLVKQSIQKPLTVIKTVILELTITDTIAGLMVLHSNIFQQVRHQQEL